MTLTLSPLRHWRAGRVGPNGVYGLWHRKRKASPIQPRDIIFGGLTLCACQRRDTSTSHADPVGFGTWGIGVVGGPSVG